MTANTISKGTTATLSALLNRRKRPFELLDTISLAIKSTSRVKIDAAAKEIEVMVVTVVTVVVVTVVTIGMLSTFVSTLGYTCKFY